jgi:predicted nuclease with TOPRIM domain
MKYKKLYFELKEKFDDLEYSYERRNEELKKSEGQVEGMNSVLGRLEGKENSVLVENEWLKDTLRLVIVPPGKEKELAKLIELDRKIDRFH